jgi:hypothetical protein
VAIGREAITAGYTVLFVAAPTLVAQLAKAHAEGRLEEKLTQLGLSGILCAGPVDHHARTNLSSNMMANWVFASPHSRGDIFHSAAV